MRTTPLALLALALSACSWLPLPTTVDLLPRLGQQASGSYRTSVAASMPAPLDAKLPDEAGAIAGFSDEAPPVTVEWGELRYDIQISYQGPALSGSLQAVLYLAPDNGERLWQEKYQLGAP
ncbi:MAG TPA: hypothetical protein VF171_07360 [Trueperaceae bacterium]